MEKKNNSPGNDLFSPLFTAHSKILFVFLYRTDVLLVLPQNKWEHLAEGAVTNRGELQLLLWHHKWLIFKKIFASCTFQWGCEKKSHICIISERFIASLQESCWGVSRKNSATFSGTWGHLNRLKISDPAVSIRNPRPRYRWSWVTTESLKHVSFDTFLLFFWRTCFHLAPPT